MSAHQLVSFEKTSNGNLKIVPIPDRLTDIAECKGLEDIIEHQLCNGWSVVDPSDIGALTDGLIISDDIETDDHGKLVRCGKVYWFEKYAVVDPVGVLAEGRILILQGKR